MPRSIALNGDFVSSNEVLNSWKEIAAYLNRGVRTVQRWEIELDLPVRRPHGRTRSSVLALRPELDEWIRSCPLEKRENGKDFGELGATRTHGLLAEMRALRGQVNASCKGMHDAMSEFMASLRKMTPGETPPPTD